MYGDLNAKVQDPNGYYFSPVVLSNIPVDSPAFNEELFGPVFSIFRVHSLQEAIDLANASSFGLSGSIFSKNVELAKKLAL